MVTWVNIGSGKDLLPDGTKSLPEPILTYHQLVSWQLHDNLFPGSTNDANMFEMFENYIIKITTAYPRGQFSMQKHIVLNMTNLFVKEISIEHCTMCPCLWYRINCLYNGLAMKNHPAIMYNKQQLWQFVSWIYTCTSRRWSEWHKVRYMITGEWDMRYIYNCCQRKKCHQRKKCYVINDMFAIRH